MSNMAEYEKGINLDFYKLDFIVINTGCLKKTWTFFENAITPSFMDETFENFLCL